MYFDAICQFAGKSITGNWEHCYDISTGIAYYRTTGTLSTKKKRLAQYFLNFQFEFHYVEKNPILFSYFFEVGKNKPLLYNYNRKYFSNKKKPKHKNEKQLFGTQNLNEGNAYY